MKKAAVIDIGSNSIRYMEEGGSKQLLTTRLAEGLVNTGKLSEAAIIRSLRVIGTFAAQAKAQGLFVYAYATSAVRDAANSARP